MKSRFLFLFLLYLFGNALVQAAGLVASLDRTRVALGESIALTLRAPGDLWGVPDLKVLRQDFRVEKQGQRTKMTIVNGQVSSVKEWQFLLFPKRSGKLQIPSIQVGDLASDPISIEVLPPSQAQKALGRSSPVLVEAEVDQKSPFVQEQVRYSVRVLSRVNLRQATLEDPKGEGLLVERLGEDRTYETVRNGQRYQVIERNYALFPQHSGPLQIAPPVLSGRIAVPRRKRGSSPFDAFFGRDPFAELDDLFQPTQPVQVQGPEIRLQVRPQPKGTPTPWLPAKSFSLTETWTPKNGPFRVGEPITRTIRMLARGLTAAQLPDLPTQVPDGLNLYPDQPHTATNYKDNDLVALKEIKQAWVPTTAGNLTLPEVRLQWWDIQAQQLRTALLPARHIQVLPAKDADQNPAPQTAAPNPAPAPTSLSKALSEPTHMPAIPGFSLMQSGYWPLLSLGLGIAWLGSLFGWLLCRRRKKQTKPEQMQKTAGKMPSPAEARARLRRACASQDAKAARAALLDWAAACWSEAGTPRLEQIAARLPEPAARAIRTLDQVRYGKGAAWDGPAAWQVLQPALKQAEADRKKGRSGHHPLPELYPA